MTRRCCLLFCSSLLCVACGSEPSGGDPGETDTDTDTEIGTDTETGETDTDTTEIEIDPICMVDAPIVVLETSMGTMVVQLDGARAPTTVENFVTYASSGFYDGTIFHRVIKDFVIQGGGFEPGFELKDTLGPIPLELHPDLTHIDGAIAMALGVGPDSAESQWYITDGARHDLDGDYAVFGVLIDGFEVRDAIADVPVETIEWMGFDVGNVPVTDVLLDAAYCVEAWP